MITNQIFLALFFLYFVLMSGECSEIMNCNLQRYINDNNWTKHVMIFLSIYIFTFILNWYTFDSLVVENFDNDGKKNKNNKIDPPTTSYLKKSFYYSIIIYLVFILSTKNEGKYLFTFLLLSIGIVIGTIYTKSINSKIYSEFKNYFIISDNEKNNILNKYKKNKQDVEVIVMNQNIMSVLFIAISLILLIGSYKYYLRQSVDHSKNWSWLIFWFGYNKQCNR
jgi:hypothetical protein